MNSRNLTIAGVALSACLSAQVQNRYVSSIITGQLKMTATVNVSQIAAQSQLSAAAIGNFPDYKKTPQFPPPTRSGISATAVPSMTSLPIASATSFGFNGITHAQMRNANGGNQFSVEPPSASVAVANGYIVEGVNNAFQVYNMTGTPLLPVVLATNQVFGVTPALNRVTGFNGVFPTDIRVFHDQTIDRWFVLQRSQDNDAFGNPLNTSHLYLAVSQTSDPTQTYNVYTMDTSNTSAFRCPCVADYPQIGADQYGFYISANEYDPFELFVRARIFAFSKASFAAGANTPTGAAFSIPFGSGYEFTIMPATTPPGASYYLASNGLQYFVSTQNSFGSGLALWAMSNTASLNTTPALSLTQTVVPVLSYTTPLDANQKPGPRPLGESMIPAGPLSFIKGGDTRVQALTYSGGRLYTTFPTGVVDEDGNPLVGGAYVILSPTVRNGVLSASVLRQGYLLTKKNHVLRPSIAVNAQGRGAISFTVVGPDYFPSSAYIPVDTTSTGSTILINGAGQLPEDGFTGYTGSFFAGSARWGDYNSAVAASDGSIWMGVEYIPNLPRTTSANWGTFVSRYVP